MKICTYISILLFFSCTDMFINRDTHYDSLYFSGGAWIEVARMDSMRLSTDSNDFTIQFWVAGTEENVSSEDGPALFSLIDTQDKVKLALFRDGSDPTSITVIANDQQTKINTALLNWDDPDQFYLISILFSDNEDNPKIKGYINDSPFDENINASLDVSDTKLMLGIKANESGSIREKFWYGYFDEIRLWNTLLADSTIQYHYEYPDKFGAYYRYTEDGEKIETYLDSLIGIWRFNLSEPTIIMEDGSEYGNDGTLYTISSDYSVKLSDKGVK